MRIAGFVRDLERIGTDRFRMCDAPTSLANVKANLPIVPAVNESRIRERFHEELRLIGAVVIGPQRSIALAQSAIAVEY